MKKAARLGGFLCQASQFYSMGLTCDGWQRLNAVCNTACSVNKASNRKLRCAVYVQATQVTRYVGREKARERAVFHLDTDPAVAGDGRTRKYHFRGSKDSHAV